MFENPEIYTRTAKTKEQREQDFFLYYKNYINIPLYKRDKAQYIKNVGKVETLLKDIKDVNKSFLILYDGPIDREVFLTLFSKKDTLVSNRYVNAPQIYDVFWEKSGKDNLRLDDDEVMYSTQNYYEDVLCIYMSSDLYVHGVGPIINSVIESRYNRYNRKGDRLVTWLFYRGRIDKMLADRDFKMPYHYFESMDKEDFQIIDLNTNSSGIVINTTTQSENGNSLSDIY